MEAGVDKANIDRQQQIRSSCCKNNWQNSTTPEHISSSGCDAVYVLPGADMHRVCDVLMFGMRLNGGATCMAPRRVFIPKKYSEVFHRLLAQRANFRVSTELANEVTRATHQKLWDGIESAIRSGARIFESETKASYPDLRQLETNWTPIRRG